jgi:hypothetical protein
MRRWKSRASSLEKLMQPAHDVHAERDRIQNNALDPQVTFRL